MQEFNWTYAIGAVSLGVAMIWIIRWYRDATPQFGLKALTAVLSALLGGVVLGFFGKFGKPGTPLPNEFALYPAGLVAGILLFGALDAIKNEMDDERRRERQKKRV